MNNTSPLATRSEWIGVVAENTVLGQENKILVFLAEAFSNAKGQLETNPQQITVNGQDAQGRSYTLKVKTQSTITAEWLNRDPNRITPPIVVKGQRVRIYRYGTEEAYYWEPMNQDQHRTVQEYAVFAYAAKPNDANLKNTPTDPNNAYHQVWDGVNGRVEFSMTEANGEISPWVLQMDGKNGNLLLSDRKGNFIRISTGGTVIDIMNADKSHVQLSKQVINITAPDSINLKAENNINMTAKQINMQGSESINANTETYTIKTGTYFCEAGNEYTVNCPTINLNGQVAMGGFTTTGAGGGSGGGAVQGNMEIEGNMSVQGPVSLNGGTSNGVIEGSYIDT